MENFMKQFTFLDFVTLKAGYGLTANAGNATNAAAVFTNSSTRRPYLTEIESQIESAEERYKTIEKDAKKDREDAIAAVVRALNARHDP